MYVFVVMPTFHWSFLLSLLYSLLIACNDLDPWAKTMDYISTFYEVPLGTRCIALNLMLHLLVAKHDAKGSVCAPPQGCSDMFVMQLLGIPIQVHVSTTVQRKQQTYSGQLQVHALFLDNVRKPPEIDYLGLEDKVDLHLLQGCRLFGDNPTCEILSSSNSCLKRDFIPLN